MVSEMVNLIDFINNVGVYRKFQVDELLFVEFKCPYDDGKMGIWWHNNFFAYVTQGEAKLKTLHEEYLLKPGDCAFAKKGSVVTWNQTPEEFCELFVFMPDDFIKTVIRKHNLILPAQNKKQDSGTIILLEVDRILSAYFNSLFSYFSHPDALRGSLLKLKLEELIVNIMITYKDSALAGYFQELNQRTRPSIKEIMENNFASNLSLNDFARMCSRSLSSFKKDFSKLFKTSPGKWLRNKRLDHARYLLQTTKMNTDEVCMECGFENRSHFIRVFKEKFGTTPGKEIKQAGMN